MKSEKIFNSLGDIDEKYLAEIETERKRTPVLKWCAAVLILSISVGSVIFYVHDNSPKFKKPEIEDFTGGTEIATYNAYNPSFDETTKNITPSKDKTPSQNQSSECLTVKKWSEKTITEKFNRFFFPDETEYQATSMSATIPEGKISVKLSAVDIEGFDTYENKTYTATAETFEIDGVSKEFCVGVKFSGEEKFYPYINPKFSCQSLKEFDEKISLKDNISFESGILTDDKNGTCSNFYLNEENQKELAELIFKNPSAEKVSSGFREIADSEEYLDLVTNVPFLGIENRCIMISSDGYFWTNVTPCGIVFNIGKDTAKEVFEYIESKKVDGKKLSIGVTNQSNSASEAFAPPSLPSAE